MREFKQKALFEMVGFLCAWLVVSSVVFAFRHPWATRTEQMLYIGKALTFQKVSYKDARPRE